MSELSKLFGKEEEVEIKGVKFKIKPLTVADLDLISGIDPDKPNAAAMKGLIEKVLKDSFPDATEEEINKIPINIVNELTEKIADVNKLGRSSDAESRLKARVKHTQNA